MRALVTVTRGGPVRAAWLWLALSVLLITANASGHIEPLVGRIVDLVEKSSLVVIGVPSRPPASGPAVLDISLESTLVGKAPGTTLRLNCDSRLPLGERQVIFIARRNQDLRCLQPTGTSFPVAPGDEEAYRRAVREIARALRMPAAKQVGVLRAALIPALSAGAVELRYHAALELAATVHSGDELTAEERVAIAAVRSAPGVDPALIPILERLLR